MQLKPLRRVVLTRGISNDGKIIVQALNKPLIHGRYSMAFITLPRIIKSIKSPVQNELPIGDAQTLRRNNACSSEVCPFSLPLWHLFRLTVA